MGEDARMAIIRENLALRRVLRELADQFNDGSECICGEINARHCPVHSDGGGADD
jgi:hypothetical protein